jgi:hypothetical protein
MTVSTFPDEPAQTQYIAYYRVSTDRVRSKNGDGQQVLCKPALSGGVSPGFDRCRASTLLPLRRTGPDTAIAF